MEDVKLYLDDVLKADIFIDGELVDSFNGNMAFSFVQTFYDSEVTSVVENDDYFKIVYDKSVLSLKNPDKLIENTDVKNLLFPIFKNANDCLEKKKLNKKIKRQNKYVRRQIAVSALSAAILFIGASGFMKDKSNIDIDVYSDTNYDSHVSDVVSEVSNGIVESATLNIPQLVSFTAEEVEASNSDVVDDVVAIEDEDVPSEESISNEYDEDNYDIPQAFIDYGSKSDTEKAILASENYKWLIDEYSRVYGLDSDLMLAIATQERGVHSEYTDEGGATGLMQIQNGVWDGATLSAYNFDTASWDTVVVDTSSLGNLDYNVRIGSMIYQTYLRDMDYNSIAAIQAYNQGNGAVAGIISSYASDAGKTSSEVLDDPTDLGWLEYTNYVPFGDPNYVLNVLSWYRGDGVISCFDTDGNIHSVSLNGELVKSK